MDFSVFDNRGPAETGQRLELKDPSVRDGDPLLSGKKPCAVIVRGSTARSVQEQSRARLKQKMAKGKKDDGVQVMEDVHAELCDAAFPLIVGFENIERDSRPLTTDPDDVRWFLDLTFPIMGVKEDEDGEPIFSPDGAPRFEMRNSPFAKQVTEFSADQAAALGNGKSS
jgi:hypothetical protein